MIAPSTLYLWLLLVNLLTVGLFVFTRRVLAPSPSRRTFEFFLVSYILFANPLIIVQFLPIDSFAMRVCSTSIHAFGIPFVATLGAFLICFSSPEELRHPRFWVFQANFAILLIVTLLGLIERGAEMSEQGLRPIAGPLLPYFNLTMMVYGTYFVWRSVRSYRRSDSPLLRAQLRAIFFTAIPAFGMFMVTNAVIPQLMKSYAATPVGAIWFLILFSGIAYVLFFGQALVLTEPLRKLLSLPDNRSPAALDRLCSRMTVPQDAALGPNEKSRPQIENDHKM